MIYGELLPKSERKMTIQKARKLLGREIKHLTDQEVEALITRSSALIDVVLDMYEAKVEERKLCQKN